MPGIALVSVLLATLGWSQPDPTAIDAATLRGLELRSIGPALMGGRIADIAVDPRDSSTWYLAVGSGGVWKTLNAGVTWTPIFDDQPSYSIGCVTLDPTQPDVVWVGTGENVSGRHVGWGDGVYKSLDGGATWKRMGLPRSEHIGDIVVDPRDGNVVYVAAEGPLWSAGGERGLYKTTDGGETWQPSLVIDEDTGVTDLEMDPRNPDVLYAASYQRRRHVWALLAGGQGSGLHKSTDGGETWRRLSRGLPSGDMGKIGLAISPVNPDVVYATIEASDEEKGFYRSLDRGERWEKRNPYISGGTGPHYYQEIVASPVDVDRVYQMDVFLHVTRDGGKTFDVLGTGREKHSDNHALVIDPEDPEHLLAGTDASLYESFDDGQTWRQFPNLPLSQFYKLALDTAAPFYNIVGGAQDLGTLLGPSRTINSEGVRNVDWYVPLGADGYDSDFDPDDPNIVYMHTQGGNLWRYDRLSHELIDIRPTPLPDDAPERFNWDAPLLVSPHSSSTLYYASQRLWRSKDRGESWSVLSGDLTRGTPRYEMEMMERVWSVDALYGNTAMSLYGTITSLAESPLVSGLLYVGTDDGLIQVSEDGGSAWRSSELPGPPDRAFINDLQASLHDPDTVFIAIDAHKTGDFSPYLYESNDRGRTWRSIAGDLPDGEIVWSFEQDHVASELLFIGAESGLYFSPDGGARWVGLEGGVPTIAFRDIEIQRRDSDLVGASFGRGFYVLDDYQPLRDIRAGAFDRDAFLFPVRDAWWYIPSIPMQARGKPSLGSDDYTADNPPYGAVITFYLKRTALSAQASRRERETAQLEDQRNVDFPGWETLHDEATEQDPKVVLTVRDEAGDAVRRIEAEATAGLHRVSWDLRYAPPHAIDLETPGFVPPWVSDPQGPFAPPGRYRVEMALVTRAATTPMGEPVGFEVKAVASSSYSEPDYTSVTRFGRQSSEQLRRAEGAAVVLEGAVERLRHMRPALIQTPSAELSLFDQLDALERDLASVRTRLIGDRVRARLSEPTVPSVLGRLRRIANGHWDTRQAPTATQEQSLQIATTALEGVVVELRSLMDRLTALELELEAAGAPWTPGRALPR